MRSAFDPIALAAPLRQSRQSTWSPSTFVSRQGVIAPIAAPVREAIASSVFRVSDARPCADFHAATRNISSAVSRPRRQIASRMSSPGSS